MALKRIFLNKDTYKKAQEELNQIEIIGVGVKEITIKGLVQSKFQLVLNATWEPMLQGLLSGLDTVTKITQGASAANITLLSTGLFTRKFFKGGTYLAFTPSFRIVDWTGRDEGESIVQVAKSLLEHTVPGSLAPGAAQIKRVARSIRERFGSGKDKDSKNPIANLLSQTGKSLVKAIVPRYSPKPVQVRISNFFNISNVIIDSVTVEFSKEITSSGPLWADFTVAFSALESTTSDTIGISLPKKSPRVKIQGADGGEQNTEGQPNILG